MRFMYNVIEKMDNDIKTQENNLSFNDFFRLDKTLIDNDYNYFFVIENIINYYEVIFPFEISLMNKAEMLSEEDLNNLPRLLFINKVLRSSILHSIYSGLLKKRHRKLIVENSFPIIDSWLDDLELTANLFPKGYVHSEFKNKNQTLLVKSSILSICKHCFEKHKKTVMEDGLCRKNINSKDCKKIYIRDFVNPLMRRIKELQNILKNMTLNSPYDSNKLYSYIENMKELINKTSSVMLKKIQAFKNLKDKDFIPYIDTKSLNLIPVSKISRYDKEFAKLMIKYKDFKKEDFKNAVLELVKKHPNIHPYELNRLSNKY
ncbi:MAG: hypothetical protein A3F80_04905 [Candidatus Melainabacteria bacterium RIFCSPLOWO2_12_FULL_35_11]|nr:MAG: hypothetical protein A3F80_04905 [Candidatus Melainabacteria bacterium RIFCSPLOWO2_12_FULL_35_11]